MYVYLSTPSLCNNVSFINELLSRMPSPCVAAKLIEREGGREVEII